MDKNVTLKSLVLNNHPQTTAGLLIICFKGIPKPFTTLVIQNKNIQFEIQDQLIIEQYQQFLHTHIYIQAPLKETAVPQVYNQSCSQSLTMH